MADKFWKFSANNIAAAAAPQMMMMMRRMIVEGLQVDKMGMRSDSGKSTLEWLNGDQAKAWATRCCVRRRFWYLAICSNFGIKYKPFTESECDIYQDN